MVLKYKKPYAYFFSDNNKTNMLEINDEIKFILHEHALSTD